MSLEATGTPGRPQSSTKFMISLAVTVVSAALLFSCTAASGPSVLENIQGKWSLVAVSETKVGNDGAACADVQGSFEIVGSALRGNAMTAQSTVFDISANVTKTGDVTLGLAVSNKIVARGTGSISEGGGSGAP